MKCVEHWEGQIEKDKRIEYDDIRLSSDYCVATEIRINASSIETSYEQADKTDYIVAASCGILAGLFDSFWVGEFSLEKAQNWGRSKTNSFVIRVAQLNGYEKNDLEGAIRFLEKKAPIPSDQLTPIWGGGLQHHFRDFAHHASIIGLVFSVMSQFTGFSYGTNTNGLFEIHEIPNRDLIGNSLEEKLFNGIVIWALHLVSDMAGSSTHAGKGTGIPGPILSLAKELSVLPKIRDIQIEYNNTEITLSVMLSKIFNGTAFEHTTSEDIIRFDLRTEMGVLSHAVKQSIPVVINECMVRAFYFVKRLMMEISNKQVAGIKSISKLEPRHFVPWNNRCIVRMLTISSGVFCAVDASDAAIRAFLKAPQSKTEFFTQFLLRTNIVGIGNFIISIKNDVSINMSRNKQLTAVEEMNSAKSDTNMLNEQVVIDVSTKIDNTGIYEYAFGRMISSVRRDRNQFRAMQNVCSDLERDILGLEHDEDILYDYTISSCYGTFIFETEKIILRLLTLYDVEYFPIPDEYKRRYSLLFYRKENGMKIGYCFVKSVKNTIEWKTIRDSFGFDKIIIVAFVEWGENYEARDIIVGDAVNNSQIDLEYITLKDLFEQMAENEYDIFWGYVEKYKSKIREIIGCRSLVVPQDDQTVDINTGDITYEKLEEWLDKIIGGDNLLPKSSKIYFQVNAYKTDKWKLIFSTVSGFTKKGYPENQKWPYIEDNLTWDRILEKEATEKKVVDLIKEYLKNSYYSEIIKEYAMISAGWFGNPQILYENPIS